MYETLLRPHEVAQLPAPIPIQAVRDKLQVAEVQKEERRLKQIAASRAKKDMGMSQGPSTATESGGKRKHGAVNNDAIEEADDGGPSPAKKAKTQEVKVEENKHDLASPFPSSVGLERKGLESSPASPSPFLVTQPIKEVRGHTSYLMFACLVPSIFPTPKAAHPPTPEIEAVPEPVQPSPEPERLQPASEDNGPQPMNEYNRQESKIGDKGEALYDVIEMSDQNQASMKAV